MPKLVCKHIELQVAAYNDLMNFTELQELVEFRCTNKSDEIPGHRKNKQHSTTLITNAAIQNIFPHMP